MKPDIHALYALLKGIAVPLTLVLVDLQTKLGKESTLGAAVGYAVIFIVVWVLKNKVITANNIAITNTVVDTKLSNVIGAGNAKG